MMSKALSLQWESQRLLLRLQGGEKNKSDGDPTIPAILSLPAQLTFTHSRQAEQMDPSAEITKKEGDGWQSQPPRLSSKNETLKIFPFISFVCASYVSARWLCYCGARSSCIDKTRKSIFLFPPSLARLVLIDRHWVSLSCCSFFLFPFVCVCVLCVSFSTTGL